MAPVPVSLALTSLLLIVSSQSEGGKLLVVPQDGSHWLSMRSLVEELQQRGHEIVLVVPEVSILIGTSHKYTVKTFPVPYTKKFMEGQVKQMSHDLFAEESFIGKFVTLYEKISNVTEVMIPTCEMFLRDQELLQFLQGVQFDALLIDPVFPCGQIIAEYLSIPSIFFMRAIPCALNHQAPQCPSPSSYVPHMFTSYSDHMTFSQRVKNLLMTLPDMWLCHTLYSPYSRLASQ